METTVLLHHIMNDKQQKRRDRIITLAEEKFLADGFVKVSLDELVSQLRISKSTVYEFFGSKEGLLRAVVHEISDRLEQGLEEIINDSKRSVKKRVIEIAAYQSETTKNLTNKFIDELKVHALDIWEEYQERRRGRIKNYYGKLIDEGIASGLFHARYSKEFLLQLYLKMSEIISYTDILEHIPMTKPQANTTIMEVFIRGTRR